jgi:hypothetical protein
MVVLPGGTITVVLLGGDEPSPLAMLHAARASMVRTRAVGTIFLCVIECHFFVGFSYLRHRSIAIF